MQNQLNKLRIISLKNPKDAAKTGPKGPPDDGTGISRVFEVQINPEQISRALKIKYKDPGEPGAKGSELQFDKVEPETLEIKFILDGTGVVPSVGSGMALPVGENFVPDKIKDLQSVVYEFIDETHRTPFIIVNWGKMNFPGVLDELTYTYNLFHPSGVPLRAEVTLKVKEHTPAAKAAAEQSLLSPDLTRRRLLRQSDTLLTVCQQVYESPVFYLEVAKANNLTNFRRKPLMNSGGAGVGLSELILPPIDKRTNP